MTDNKAEAEAQLAPAAPLGMAVQAAIDVAHTDKHDRNDSTEHPRTSGSTSETETSGAATQGEARRAGVSSASSPNGAQTTVANSVGKAPIRKFDFWIVPIPSWRRYDPDKPFKFSPALNFLFAFAAIFTVANLYYCQPLLVQFSETFGITYAESTHVPTLLQGGYAGGLLFISPMGDMARRRQLSLLLVLITTLLTVGLAITKSFVVFEVLSFIIGFITVTPQIMIPLAADLAPLNRRAQSMATVLAGLTLGMLVARVLGGSIAEFTSWRNVYWMSVGGQSVVLVLLYLTLPDYPPKNPHLRYFEIHPTMFRYLYTNPVLIHGSLLGLIGSSIFSGFWVVLTFLLSAEPYRYSTLVIGLFGLVGIAGVCTAPFVGKLIDRLVPWVGALIGNCFILVSCILLMGGSQASVAVIVISILFLDIGQQMQQVSNQSRIYSTNVNAGARLNAVYIISLFLGQLVGSSLNSKMYLEHGARPYYALTCGLVGLNLVILVARGPLKSNTKWLGWGRKDEWAVVKRRPEAQKPDAEKALQNVDGEADKGALQLNAENDGKAEENGENEAKST